MTVQEQLTKLITEKLDEIDRLETEVERLSQALQVLNPGENHQVRSKAVESVEVESRPVPPLPVSPKRSPEPVDTRPLCGGCGGRMEPAFRTLSSGKTVNYLVCTDTGCNNEQLLS